MGCDFYIVTVLEGVGQAAGGNRVDIQIEYKRECGYFTIADDSDDEKGFNQAQQMKRHEKISQLSSEKRGWDNDEIREKYHAIVKGQYPDVETIHSLAKFMYTHLRT